MHKKEIYAISDLDHLSITQYVSTLKEFVSSDSKSLKPNPSSEFDFSNIPHCKSLVVKSEKWRSMTEIVQVKPEHLLLCFDSSDNYVCMRDQVRYSNHLIVLPGELQLDGRTYSHFSFADKCALLYQISVTDDNNMLELPWCYLCTPQMLSIAQYLGLSLSLTQIQSSQNPSKFMEAKCRQSRCFRENYGSGSYFKYATFSFSLDSILDVIGISMNFPSSAITCSLNGTDGELAQPFVSYEQSSVNRKKSNQQSASLINCEENNGNGYLDSVVPEECSESKSEIHEIPEPAALTTIISSSVTASIANCHTEVVKESEVQPNHGINETSEDSRKEISFDNTDESPRPIQQSTPLLSGKHNLESTVLLPTRDSIELHKSRSRTPISQKKYAFVAGEFSNKESFIQENLLVDNELVINVQPCIEKYVENDICFTCKKGCKNECLKCYVCQREVHYSCYKTQGTKTLIEEEFCASSSLNNHKWFCNKCVDLTIQDILALATEKVRYSIQSSCNFLEESNLQSANSTVSITKQNPKDHQLEEVINLETKPHSSSFNEGDYSDITMENSSFSSCSQKEKLSYLNEAIIVEKVTQCITQKMDELKEFITTEVISSPMKTYAEIMKPPNHEITNQKDKNHEITNQQDKKNSGDLSQKAFNYENSNRANKFHSLVINNVQERRFIKDASSIKKEFSKYFKQCKIVSAFPTRSGALIIEVSSREEAEMVYKGWKPSFFSPEEQNFKEEYRTSCKIMSELQNYKAIIKNVEYNIADDTISNELAQNYPGAVFKRFITREGKSLKTGIIEFKTQQQLTDTLYVGHLQICNMKLEVHEYIHKRKVIQCFNCKQFDHVRKWCPNKYSCGNCSKDHIEDECRTPQQLRCTNCKSSHSSLDKNCPFFVQKSQVNRTLSTKELNE